MSHRNWLPDFLRRGREATKGDVIGADVGEGAHDVIVGKNVIKIGKLAIPLWAVLAVVVAVAVIAVVSIYSVLSNQAQYGNILKTVSATPTPTPMPAMTGSFNVAIAEFSIEGQGAGVETAQRLVQDFANQVESTVHELEAPLGKIEVRLPRDTGQIVGADSQARALAARALAKKIGADVVVYGVVSVDGDKATISPEFYINESVNAGLVEAPEITGQYEMGRSVAVQQISNRDLRSQAARQLEARLHALTAIIDGLSAYVAGDYNRADQRFADALNENAWDNTEVLYVLLGNALMNEGVPKKDAVLFKKAEGYYRQAIQTNAKYSRGYVGLGSVLYEEAATNQNASSYSEVARDLLDQAIQNYQKALEAGMVQPPLADVPAKVNFGLGQAYLLKALVLQSAGQAGQASQLLGQAVQAFQAVIDEYRGASSEAQSRLQERAAHAYARMGLIHRFTNRLDQAQEMYTQAIPLVPELDRTRPARASYQAALGDIYLRQGKLSDARSRYEQAVALAPDGSAEKTKYQDTLVKLQAQNAGGAGQ